MSEGKERELQGEWEVTDKGRYHPVAFDQLQERFMDEIRINGKRLTALELVISPLMARIHCECTDYEAKLLVAKATEAAEKACDDFGGLDNLRENFQIWLDHQRKTKQL